jgi:hypothetical protein
MDLVVIGPGVKVTDAGVASVSVHIYVRLHVFLRCG